MIIGVPKERCPGETRVALVPANVAALVKKGHDVLIETGAGDAAGYLDDAYTEAGATLADRARILNESAVVVQVQTPGQNRVNGDEDLAALRAGQLLIGLMDPLGNPDFSRQLADKGIQGMAMEMIPRISRAQSMDVLSSMAMIAGYKAVLMAASASPRMLPMNMTAAGTLKAARVFIMGAGVAGLQACATARRLGAIVEAYDVRAAAREQILSVGAKPVELQVDEVNAEGQGGYASEQSEEFLRKQREAMAEVLAQQDVVITTAAVPGAKSPILVTTEMLTHMKPGAVIVDLAAERGGNCELTRLGETVVEHGVTIIGPENVPSTVAYHASQMYGKNIENTLDHLISEEGTLSFDREDEIIAGTLVAYEGEVPHPKMRELLGLSSND